MNRLPLSDPENFFGRSREAVQAMGRPLGPVVSDRLISDVLRGLPAEVTRALKHVGLFSRVAANGGWSVTHVLNVAKGKRQSKAVMKAIIAEVRRVERDCEGAA